MRSTGRVVLLGLALALGGASISCGGSTDGGEERQPPASEVLFAEVMFPDVLGAEATETGDGVWRFDVTLSSPYDTSERYADAWRVVGDDGVVYGVRELSHDHQAEQPFTRSLDGVEIPAAVAAVTVEGRDQHSGWGGETYDLVLQR